LQAFQWGEIRNDENACEWYRICNCSDDYKDDTENDDPHGTPSPKYPTHEMEQFLKWLNSENGYFGEGGSMWIIILGASL
jgi:hypothetical protein